MRQNGILSHSTDRGSRPSILLNAIAAWLTAPAILEADDETELAAIFFGDFVGIFVEVGANEPIHLSQTYHLEQRGWTGLLIEPISEWADELRKVRRAQVAEVACGGPADHGKTMPFKLAGDGGIGSTLADSTIHIDTRIEGVRQVRVITLDAAIEEAGLPNVDFLTIDVEGYEPEVLRGFSIERFRPKLVLIEDRVRESTNYDYMRRHGYKLVRHTGVNAWYVPKETPFPVSVYGALQLFRKYNPLGIYLRTKRKRRRQLRHMGQDK